MKKVVSIVLNNFKNDSRVLKECISMQQAGYDVRVVALHEAGLLEKETIQNIPVHRIRLKTRGWSKHSFIQIIKYVEFMLRFIKNYRKTDYIHCNGLELLFVSVLLKWLTFGRAKIVYDAHEFETEKSGMKHWEKKVSHVMERTLINQADQVLSVSEGIALEYAKRYNISKPDLVMNCPFFVDVPKRDLFRQRFQIGSDKKIFLYQGGLYRGRGLEMMIHAFRQIQREDVVLVIMGFGELEGMVTQAANTTANIFYHEAVAPDVLLQYTASADIGISFIENICLSYYYCVPNKFFEYAMAGLPILVSNSHELKKFTEYYQCGSVVQEYTVSSLLDGIERILQMDLAELSQNSRKMAKIHSWQEQEKILLHAYEGLAL
jgi:glycosyltransferase involved in cell wall biosynthesis